MATCDCNCNTNTPQTNQNSVGLNMCVGMVEIGSGSITQSKTVSPTTATQVVKPDSGYDALEQVTVRAVTKSIDANIKPENIREGITILGVVGTFKGAFFDIAEYPPYCGLGNEYSLATYTLIKDGGAGYQVELPSEEEDDEGNVSKQRLLIASQFPIVGIKQFDIVSQKWAWVFGSVSESLEHFVMIGTTTLAIDGTNVEYTIYENTTGYIMGDREVRFYTELPTEV